jgi:predicted metalloprotease
MGADPRQLLEQLPTQTPSSRTQSSRAASPEEEEQKQFVATVLANTEDVWTDLFREMGRQYRDPKLVLFNDQVESSCGLAGAAVAPSIVRAMRSFTSIYPSSKSCRRGFARQETLPRPM